MSEPSAPVDPLAVEVTRGDLVESRHRARAVVVDAAGRVVGQWGEVAAPVYPRSAIKPIQALPLIETGAADRFELGDAEIALACASHNAEPVHVEIIEAWLARIGLTDADLECGAHAPLHEPSAAALWRSGGEPRAVHNNCSGKHTGFLTTAVHMGEPTRGYIGREHPVQRRVAAAIADMAGVDVDDAPCAIDGCSIPTFAIPLTGLATAMTRLADPSALAPARAAALARIRTAMTARPDLVAGTGRACTAIIGGSDGRLVVKTGAEGVYAAALPAQGLGLAVKVDDGAGRASSVALLAVIDHLGALDEALAQRLADVIVKPLHNRRGIHVGDVRPAASWPPA